MTIKVSDGIRSERAFDLQEGNEGRRVSRLTSRGETTRRTTVTTNAREQQSVTEWRKRYERAFDLQEGDEGRG
jgi:hypothetical protein